MSYISRIISVIPVTPPNRLQVSVLKCLTNITDCGRSLLGSRDGQTGVRQQTIYECVCEWRIMVRTKQRLLVCLGILCLWQRVYGQNFG